MSSKRRSSVMDFLYLLRRGSSVSKSGAKSTHNSTLEVDREADAGENIEEEEKELFLEQEVEGGQEHHDTDHDTDDESSTHGDLDSSERILESIRKKKGVIEKLRSQPWPMQRKLKTLRLAQKFLEKHEAKVSKTHLYKEELSRRWKQFKRWCTNFSIYLIPWEARIKCIESRFGSVVSSYFTFLRWIFWLNLIMSVFMVVFIVTPELLADSSDDVNRTRAMGWRKRLTPDEEKTDTALSSIWEFEGVVRNSPLFYGYYGNQDIRVLKNYQLPLAYFLVYVVVLGYSFFAILRKMAENARRSKMAASKTEHYTFSWRAFTAWDYTIGNAETAANTSAATTNKLRESINEFKARLKEKFKWLQLFMRIFANIVILSMIAGSAYLVHHVVSRSTATKNKEEQADLSAFRKNEVPITVSLITLFFPNFFELIGKLERYHPRTALRIHLGRVLMLYLINFYTLMIALFTKMNEIANQQDSIGLPVPAKFFAEPGNLSRALRSMDVLAPATTAASVTVASISVATMPLLIAFLRNMTGVTPPPGVPPPSEEDVDELVATFVRTLREVKAKIEKQREENEGLTNNTTKGRKARPTKRPRKVNSTTSLKRDPKGPTKKPEVTFRPINDSLDAWIVTLQHAGQPIRIGIQNVRSFVKQNVTPEELKDLLEIDITYGRRPFEIRTTAMPTTPHGREGTTTEENPPITPEMYEYSVMHPPRGPGNSWLPEVLKSTSQTPVSLTTAPHSLPSEENGIDDGLKSPRAERHFYDQDGKPKCWENYMGQEICRLITMDFVMTVLAIVFIDFFRGLVVRFCNTWWCWNLETRFPEYGEFKVAENVLHLVNNQGMIWLGLFFAPLLPAVNNLKLILLMYLRSWACITCNVPAQQVFRASRSSNFYIILLLLMLFLCTLPVMYVIASQKPSKGCGPFSGNDKFYKVVTKKLSGLGPKVDKALDYVASPGIIIPLLVLLVLVIYFLVSLTRALRESNEDLKRQLVVERTEEKRKVYALAGGGHHDQKPPAESRKTTVVHTVVTPPEDEEHSFHPEWEPELKAYPNLPEISISIPERPSRREGTYRSPGDYSESSPVSTSLTSLTLTPRRPLTPVSPEMTLSISEQAQESLPSTPPRRMFESEIPTPPRRMIESDFSDDLKDISGMPISSNALERLVRPISSTISTKFNESGASSANDALLTSDSSDDERGDNRGYQSGSQSEGDGRRSRPRRRLSTIVEPPRFEPWPSARRSVEPPTAFVPEFDRPKMRISVSAQPSSPEHSPESKRHFRIRQSVVKASSPSPPPSQAVMTRSSGEPSSSRAPTAIRFVADGVAGNHMSRSYPTDSDDYDSTGPLIVRTDDARKTSRDKLDSKVSTV